MPDRNSASEVIDVEVILCIAAADCRNLLRRQPYSFSAKFIFRTIRQQLPKKNPPMTNHATGPFDVKLAPQDDKTDDATLGRMTIDKQFHGDLEATSKGQMLTAGPVFKSASTMTSDYPITNFKLPDYHSMSKFAEPMSRLIDELKKLPGVGSKSAQRLAFYILRSSDEDAEALAAAVRDVKANLRLCSVCNNITDVDPCVYCTSATRNQRLVCVVEEPTNIAAIEKTKHFNGVFHVLHGAISPLHGIGPGAVAHLQPHYARRRRQCGRSHHRHQSHRGRRSHRHLSFAATQARRSEGHAHRHGHPGRQRHRIHRRDHHAESDGRAAGTVTLLPVSSASLCRETKLGSDLKHRTSIISTAFRGRAVQVAPSVEDQAGIRVVTVARVDAEVMQYGLGPCPVAARA